MVTFDFKPSTPEKNTKHVSQPKQAERDMSTYSLVAIVLAILIVVVYISYKIFGDYGWDFWEWVVGLGGVAGFITLYYLTDDKNSRTTLILPTTIILGVVIALNAILMHFLGDVYKVVFCCFSISAFISGVLVSIFTCECNTEKPMCFVLQLVECVATIILFFEGI